MKPDAVALLATVILMLPMGYFLLASPAFLLVKLDIPEVTQLLRGMFDYYLLAVIIFGVIATLAFAVAGRLGFTLGLALIAAFAASERRWFMRRMDAQLSARDAGDTGAVRRLRWLYCAGMLCNAIQLGALIVSIPYIGVTTA
jgi:hypothetical protein